MSSEPRVSCLMVTQKSRLRMAADAVKCFRAQTYRNRELVVVSDDMTREEIMALAPSDLPFMGIQAPDMPLGDLRNIGIARASGEYIAQWDDDDLYHAERLHKQILRLEQHQEAEACFLTRITFAWPAKNHYATSLSRRWECSMVAMRRRIPIYPALARGEDTPVANALRATWLDEPELYVRRIHGSNTWNDDHFSSILTLPLLAPNEVAAIKNLTTAVSSS